MVVLPAYNAASTLERTVAEIPREIVDDLLLVDDASGDTTVEVAQRLDLPYVVHSRNRGYGGNQKTCYTEALRRGADIVVMLHPDYQYTPKLIGARLESRSLPLVGEGKGGGWYMAGPLGKYILVGSIGAGFGLPRPGPRYLHCGLGPPPPQLSRPSRHDPPPAPPCPPDPGDHVSMHWQGRGPRGAAAAADDPGRAARRPVAGIGTEGSVVAGGAEAVAAGLAMLQGGGNAADAAVATILALSVTDANQFCFGGEVPIRRLRRAGARSSRCSPGRGPRRGWRRASTSSSAGGIPQERHRGGGRPRRARRLPDGARPLRHPHASPQAVAPALADPRPARAALARRPGARPSAG